MKKKKELWTSLWRALQPEPSCPLAPSPGFTAAETQAGPALVEERGTPGASPNPCVAPCIRKVEEIMRHCFPSLTYIHCLYFHMGSSHTQHSHPALVGATRVPTAPHPLLHCITRLTEKLWKCTCLSR